MVFSTPTFIFLFLPIVLIIYYLSSPKYRNLILFLGSLVFYAWGEPIYIGIMLFSTVFDYINGIMIHKYKSENQMKKARLILIGSVVVNLGILGFFKYTNFFINNINSLLGSQLKLLDLSLPIGISFYTFQTMSYTIDVYLGDTEAQKNIINFGAYVTLFPQLVAGPIVRYRDIADQLDHREHTVDKFSYGIRRFTIGLFKKVILANNIGAIWQQIASQPIQGLSFVGAWLGAIAYSFQIYFDFSGYSDMAIGLGSMLGFKFLKNFDYPYISKSITEFWRRWHISLGTWFKEYVYIPLGGSRVGKKKLIRNILIVWMLTGFWHGASWNFIIWGLYFGLILIIEKSFLLKKLEKLPALVSHIYSLILIIFGWIIFYFEDLTKIRDFGKTMFGLRKTAFIDSESIYLISSNWFLIAFCFLASTRLLAKGRQKLVDSNKPLIILGERLGYIGLFILSLSFLIGASYNPFLYFKF